MRLNINYTVALWDGCSLHEVPFIYASSAATYGARKSGFLDDDSPAALAALWPLNPYGWSKKVADDIFAMRAATGAPTPPQWVGLKFFNAYSPNEYDKSDMISVAAKLFDTITRRDPVQLFKSYHPGIADGEQRRDFVYVRDCTRSIVRLGQHSNVSCVFNIGTGKGQLFLHIVKAFQVT